MAIKENKITIEGENFIRKVCGSGDSKLKGTNGPLPYSDDGNGNLVNKTWTAKPTIDGDVISNNTELAEALIIWFNQYGKLYGLDPNILAAQAYIESNYNLWTYAKTSTASGINQFTMETVYGVIVNDFSNVEPKMNSFDKEKIITGLTDELALSSYRVSNGTPVTTTIAKKNRSVLHQNIIDNPDVMIKAQARYMKYFSNNSSKLASTSLFCYSRGSSFLSNTYSGAINNVKKSKNEEYLKEGLDYVLKVWGVLGDKNNRLNILGTYKPKAYYFGYDSLFTHNGISDLTSYPNGNFDEFDANVNESKEFNIQNLDDLTIVENSNYKFIKFPPDQYYTDEQKNKIQIVLHHTVSGGKEDVAGDVKWWRDKNEKIATSFIISRTGFIYQLFNTDYWAYHLGLSTNNNLFLNQRSIGIEIDSWGGLINSGGQWYPTIYNKNKDLQTFTPKENAIPLSLSNVQLYDKSNGYDQGFRGFYGFEKYTTDQINAVRDLILSLKLKFPDIDLVYKEDIWDFTNKKTGMKGVSQNALNGISGVWTHVSYRKDKSDCHPQPELIEMLKDLSVNNNKNFNYSFSKNVNSRSNDVNLTSWIK